MLRQPPRRPARSPQLGGLVLCVASVIATLLPACDRPTYDPPTLIKSLRVLSVRADPPYLTTAPTALNPFVVGQEAGSELCYAWALCAFAWENNGNYECLDPALQLDLGNAATANVSLLDALPMLSKVEGVLKKKGFNQPKDLSVDGNSDGNTDEKPKVQAGNNLELQIIYQVSEARVWGGTCPKDTAKMLAKPCPTRNGCMFGHKGLAVAIPSEDGKVPQAVHHNPKLEMIALDGVPWPAEITPTVPVYKAPDPAELQQLNTTQGLEMKPIWSPDSVELIAKSTEPDVPDRKERLIFSFYATAGAFQYRRTGHQVPENGYQAEAPKPAGTIEDVTLWVVVRDDRGGTDWLVRHLRVDANAPADKHPLCGPDPSLPKCDEVTP